jgi:hypothetical protein
MRYPFRKRPVFVLMLCFCILYTAVQAQKKISLEGVNSPYSELLKTYFQSDALKKRTPAASLTIECLQTENDMLYIGIQQEFIVKAPLSRLVAVLEDFNNYPAMFEDVVKAAFTKKSDGYYTLWQEQKIPVPFVSNIKYSQSYYIESAPKSRRYLYKLLEGKDFKYNDGMIQITKLNDNECSFYEVDFVYGDWSVIGKIANDTVWKSAVKGAIVSNMTIKIRAENPDWSMDKVKDEAHRISDAIDYAGIVSKKKMFKELK